MRMKARLVQIGNSRGVRLSKALLEHAALADDVVIDAEPGAITIRSAHAPRAGWAEAAAHGPHEPVMDDMSTAHFDDTEWTW
jgi:antitoxin MazE